MMSSSSVDGVAVYPHPIRSEWKLLAKLRLEVCGLKATELSAQLGVSAHTVRSWMKRPEYQAYETWLIERSPRTYDPEALALPSAVAPMEKPVIERINEYANEMFDRLQSIMETSENEKLVAQICMDGLDRAGAAAVRKVDARPIQFIITPEVYSEIMKRKEESLGTVVVGELVSGVTERDPIAYKPERDPSAA